MLCGDGHADGGAADLEGEPGPHGVVFLFHDVYRTNLRVKAETHLHCPGRKGRRQTPTLNASEIPHTVCHGAFHGALGTRNIGESMIPIAPHVPIPPFEKVEAREEIFGLEHLQEGPQGRHIGPTQTA